MKELFDRKAIEVIRSFLMASQETIAVAESVTSGFIQAAFSTAEDASLFFQGGITAYNVGQKFRHLRVEPVQALACNCVSEKIAQEMALHVCDLFHSQWGIGITGYAAPVPESDNNLYAYYTIVYKGMITSSRKITAKKDESVRVQLFYVNETLSELARYIQKLINLHE
ncbi:CinA family protein [Emticicia sp. BO119]|uniref:CinA family protein n=1 Tax=Emticicia sp. BO119 TaxID=2757768 RepID=UPI0015F01EE9|nr:nicotinamide-nucleotide amidohydrolase family protein [Emticicia sp. BO119]MBA4852772.1 nicotinamide-nucleotide amidohydrolase family protein [Emticicia sp. BO119]